MLAWEILFWLCVVLLVYAQFGYPLVLAALGRLRHARAAVPAPAEPPTVSLIVAAYDEEAVIGRKVDNALALDYPRERLEVVSRATGHLTRRCARLGAPVGKVIRRLRGAGSARQRPWRGPDPRPGAC